MASWNYESTTGQDTGSTFNAKAQPWSCCFAAATRPACAGYRTGQRIAAECRGLMAETFSHWDAANYIDTPEDAGLFLEAQ